MTTRRSTRRPSRAAKDMRVLRRLLKQERLAVRVRSSRHPFVELAAEIEVTPEFVMIVVKEPS